MGKDKKLLLVHTSMESVSLDESVNVLLTPQFYTLKKESLPVKYAYQAKKIAPSLFDGLLEEGGHYQYMVMKEEETWVFIAYDLERITAFLESKGLTADKVSKVFFAQQAVHAFTAPLALNEKEALVVLDDTVVLVPRMALGSEEKPTLAFDSSFTPKGGVSLQGGSRSIITQKQALSLAAVFVLFAGMFLVEGSRDGGENESALEELESLYTSYPALQSSYARQGIVDKYRNVDTKERKKRDAIKAFAGMIFKGVTLTALQVNEKGFQAQFSCANTEVAKRVKALAKKAHYNTAKVKGSTDLRIEGTL
ncbi:MAG TPA: hypothetical protein ENK39_01035 [Epsilonproteobacteria bacterium]|nr:hypothetical protein [Campylobacterota bacterium]